MKAVVPSNVENFGAQSHHLRCSLVSPLQRLHPFRYLYGCAIGDRLLVPLCRYRTLTGKSVRAFLGALIIFLLFLLLAFESMSNIESSGTLTVGLYSSDAGQPLLSFLKSTFVMRVAMFRC